MRRAAAGQDDALGGPQQRRADTVESRADDEQGLAEADQRRQHKAVQTAAQNLQREGKVVRGRMGAVVVTNHAEPRAEPTDGVGRKEVGDGKAGL